MDLRSNMRAGAEQRIRALLDKASQEELQGNLRAAAATYRILLRMASPGFGAPAWMAERLQHANEIVERNRRELEAFITEGLQPVRDIFSGKRLDRFDQCVETILQKRRIYRQQPTFMFFPGLPTIEFYNRQDFPWLDSIEAAADDIRNELLEVLSEGAETLDPYVADQPGLPADKWRGLNRSRRWGVYALWREGTEFPERMRRCPKTLAALNACPRWDVPGSGPTAMFSILDAKTRIPAHTGPVNTRLVVHLPLIVPPGCGFRVGGEERRWEVGKAFVFDDSINHEAWNDGDEPRAVLVFDIWSPYLSEAERELTRALTTRIGEFYGTISTGHGL